MSLIEGVQKAIGGILSFVTNPALILIIIGLVAVSGFGVFLWFALKPDKKVLYFNENEGWGEELEIERMTPAHVYTKMKKKVAYRFIRYRAAFNFQVGMKTVTRFLAKKGTAFTSRLEGNKEVGPFTLYTIMQSIWPQEVIDSLKDEIKQKLIESTVPITVRLDQELTPKGQKPKNELFIKNEANQEMARVFGENIRREMNAEDWVRTAALIGCGVALAYVAQAMGLLAGVAV